MSLSKLPLSITRSIPILHLAHPLAPRHAHICVLPKNWSKIIPQISFARSPRPQPINRSPPPGGAGSSTAPEPERSPISIHPARIKQNADRKINNLADDRSDKQTEPEARNNAPSARACSAHPLQGLPIRARSELTKAAAANEINFNQSNEPCVKLRARPTILRDRTVRHSGARAMSKTANDMKTGCALNTRPRLVVH